MHRLGIISLVILALTAGAAVFAMRGAAADTGTVSAQDTTSPSKRDSAAKREAAKRLGVTPERQAAVMTFVKRNHPELAELLTTLKARQPDEYEGAVRELFRNTERLAQIQERDPTQYGLELALWTAQSRVQLFMARMKMGATDELQASLRAAVSDQVDARVALLKHQRQKTADRLKNLDREIQAADDNRDQAIDRQLQLLTRAASEGRPAGIVPKSNTSKSTPKPAKKLKPAAE